MDYLTVYCRAGEPAGPGRCCGLEPVIFSGRAQTISDQPEIP